jgi:glycerophosphoryl diester phosphodiesterase
MSVKHILPHANIAPLIAACSVALAQFAHDMGAQALHSNTDTTDADLMKDAHSRGLAIREQAADLLRLKLIGVDAVFVNDVAWARKVLATAS